MNGHPAEASLDGKGGGKRKRTRRSRSRRSTINMSLSPGLVILCFAIVVTLPASTRTHAATYPGDVAALKSFQREAQDPLGMLQNWLENDPCEDQWEGVFCSPAVDGLSRVTELRLLNHNLSGQLAPELGNMDGLQILDVMWNQFSGSIPKELGKLKQLTLLLLNGNNLTGPIPNELGDLVLLDRFQIDSNQIFGSIPRTFQSLINLKHLHMNNNSLSGSIPQELGNLPKLVHMLADTNNLDGLIPYQLANVSTLQILQLDNNPFTRATIPNEFNRMANLKKLSMRNCNLQGLLPDLSGLLSLDYLDLSQNELEGEIPTSHMPQNINSIDLSSNLLHGSIPDSLGRLPRLQFLALRSNNLSGHIPESFGTGAYISSSNDEILLDFQNNALSSIPTNLTNAIKYRANMFVWVHGNRQICKDNDTLIHKLCKAHHETFFPESETIDNNYGPTCDPMTCSPGEEPMPSMFYSQGLCRCAMPIAVGYRLKSPSFSFFTPYIHGYEEWIAKSILVASNQVFLASFTKEPGPRFATVLKIFPPSTGPRVFSENDVFRIYAIFSGWKLPPNDFYGPQELLFFNYTLYQEDISALSSYQRNWRFVMAILIGCAFGTVLIVAAAVAFLMRNRHCKSRAQRSMKRRILGKSESSHRLLKVTSVKDFRFEELAIATKGFSDEMLVGQGGYGRVYRGILSDGQVVAIKRAKQGSHQGQEEFHTEIELLSRVHHRNLVSLVGYCIDNNEQMLIYEYMPNGTLKDHLSGHNGEHRSSASSAVSAAAASCDDAEGIRVSSLDFAARLRVAIGAARGISYLHTEANPPIFHRDIKASNILLDSRSNARVADFGLSKLAPTPDIDGSVPVLHVSTVVKGTPGYLDPEYFLTHQLTDKSDVYSFGVVLLELVTGMQPITNGKNIVREVKSAYDNANLLNMVDTRMGAYPIEALAPLVRLALACCDDDTLARPSMGEVLRDLQGIWKSVPWPKSILYTLDHDVDTESTSSSKGHPSGITKELHKSSFARNPYLSCDDDDSDLITQSVHTKLDPR